MNVDFPEDMHPRTSVLTVTPERDVATPIVEGRSGTGRWDYRLILIVKMKEVIADTRWVKCERSSGHVENPGSISKERKEPKLILKRE